MRNPEENEDSATTPATGANGLHLKPRLPTEGPATSNFSKLLAVVESEPTPELKPKLYEN